MELKKTFAKIKTKLLLKYYNFRKYKLIFPPQGLGDILFVCALSQEYKKKYPNEKFILWVTKKHFYDLAKLYTKKLDGVILYKYPSSKYNVENLVNKIYLNKTFQELFENNKSFKSLFTYALKLNDDAELYYPKLDNKDDKSLSNTILIAPEAVSCPNNIDDKFWLSLANELKLNGYNVIFNTKNQVKFQDYEKVFWDIKTSIQKINNMKAVITYRSGLSDVIGAFCKNTSHYVIYPSHGLVNMGNFAKEEDGIKAYLEFCSIKNNFKNKLVHEYIYNENLVNILIQKMEESDERI